jgi:thiamine biosynthesis protein ThiS
LTIRLNGEPHELSGPASIAVLLDRLGIDGRRVAVEHNFVVLKRDAYGSTMVQDGDEVEIVNFVGGGTSFNAF